MKHNLLVDPFLDTRLLDGTRKQLTLPGLLAALQADEVESFPALRPHQSHPWHAFLCQLAAMALQDEELPDCAPGKPLLPGPGTEEGWRERLRALTPEHPDDAPWHLLVQDATRPAFMQPPLPGGKTKDLKNRVPYPDDLDILVSSKGHGQKPALYAQAGGQDWVLALISLQTTGGFFGSGNYGIARMNGGFATRPGVQLVSRKHPGGEWLRDVRVLLENPEAQLSLLADFDREEGHRLLWCLAWDGMMSLGIDTLHPLFIEVCRRVRLTEVGSDLVALTGGSKVARVDAKAQKGDLADPWIPIKTGKDGPSAYNRRPTYRAVWEVLFEEGYQIALLQKLHAVDGEGSVAIRFRVLVRGQGKTEGYCERTVPIPGKFRPALRGGDPGRQAAKLAKEMADMAGAAEHKVLKLALMTYLQAAREQASFDQPETNAWALRIVREMDGRLDAVFFDKLWECLDRDPEGDAVAPWRDHLRREVVQTFEMAVDTLPVTNSLRPRARARAEKKLYEKRKEHLAPPEPVGE